ncbi:uncharacterized protein B0H18DRAFT_963129, partial [Fomitopsis serialis]|uniref:uncharacterized protein n=1 Tax=Fomitopsis serialis TaxID=139415 RepID=UPI0020082A3E
ASRVNRKQPFQHKAIFQLIAVQWFYAGQRDSVIKESQGRFAEVLDNLLALVCNVIEMGLADVATGSHAPKWVNIIGVLGEMKDKAPKAYVALKQFVWAQVSELICKEEEAGKRAASTSGIGDEATADDEFVAWDDIEVIDVNAQPSGEASSSEREALLTAETAAQLTVPANRDRKVSKAAHIPPLRTTTKTYSIAILTRNICHKFGLLHAYLVSYLSLSDTLVSHVLYTVRSSSVRVMLEWSDKLFGVLKHMGNVTYYNA